MPLTYRQAVRLIREHGGTLARHGREHDDFVMPWGDRVMVPRHGGDFSPRVEADIRKRAGSTRHERG